MDQSDENMPPAAGAGPEPIPNSSGMEHVNPNGSSISDFKESKESTDDSVPGPFDSHDNYSFAKTPAELAEKFMESRASDLSMKVSTLRTEMFRVLEKELDDELPQDRRREAIALACNVFSDWNFVPSIIRSQLLASAIVMGDEKAGKSTTLANILLLAVVYSEEAVATRCCVVYQVQYNANATDKMVHIVDTTYGSESPFPQRVRIDDLSSKIRRIMERIATSTTSGVDTKGRIVVTIEVNTDVEALRLVDLPGFVGSNAAGANAHFKGEVEELVHSEVTKHLSGSLSHIFLVIRLDSELRTSNCLECLPKDNFDKVNHSNIHVVYTHSDKKITKQFVADLGRNIKGNVVSDRDLLDHLLRRHNQFFGEKTSIHLVANTTADVNENNTYEAVNSELRHASKSRQLAKLIEEFPQRKINGVTYKRDEDAYTRLRQMLDIESIKRLAGDCVHVGTKNMLEFIRSALEKEKERLTKQFKIIKHDTKHVKPTSNVGVMLFKAAHLLLEGVVSLEYEVPPKLARFMPSKQVFEEVMNGRAVRLRDEKKPTFPENLPEEVLEHIYKTLHNDGEEHPTIPLRVRFQRMVPLMVLLCSISRPDVVSEYDISKNQVSMQAVQSTDYSQLLAKKLTDFLEKTLQDFKVYLEKATRHIFIHGVESVVKLLNKIDLSEYMPEAKRQQLLLDLRFYLIDKFVEPTVDQVTKCISDAMAPVRDSIAPWAPDLLEKVHKVQIRIEHIEASIKQTREADTHASGASNGMSSTGEASEHLDEDETTKEKRVSDTISSYVKQTGFKRDDIKAWFGGESAKWMKKVVDKFGPVVTRLRTLNTTGPATSAMTVGDEATIKFNLALQRQAQAALLTVCLSLPASLAKPVLKDVTLKEALDMRRFADFILEARITKTQQDLFVVKESESDGESATADDGEKIKHMDDADFAKVLASEYDLKEPWVALKALHEQTTLEFLDINAAIATVDRCISGMAEHGDALQGVGLIDCDASGRGDRDDNDINVD